MPIFRFYGMVGATIDINSDSYEQALFEAESYPGRDWSTEDDMSVEDVHLTEIYPDEDDAEAISWSDECARCGELLNPDKIKEYPRDEDDLYCSQNCWDWHNDPRARD